MKKLFIILLAVVLLPGLVAAAEVTKTLSFAWDEPTDLAIIERWELYWSETAGGPYTKITDIPKIEGMTEFQAPATVDVTGPPGSLQTRYFVLIACGTVQSGGEPVFNCSANSNEVNQTFNIPATEFKVPVMFRILPE